MNMIRAGVVEHHTQWAFCGYNEIQNPRKRKGIVDFDRLMDLLGFENYADLKMAKLIIWIPETHFYGINNHHP